MTARALRPGRRAAPIVANARAIAHPMRVTILLAMRAGGEWTPRELDEALNGGDGLERLSYHVRALSRAGLIAPTRIEAVRGAVAHYYAVTRRGAALLEALER